VGNVALDMTEDQEEFLRHVLCSCNLQFTISNAHEH